MILYFEDRQLLVMKLTDKVIAADTTPDEERCFSAALPYDCRIDSFLGCSDHNVIDQAAEYFLPFLMAHGGRGPQGRHLAGELAEFLQFLIGFVPFRQRLLESDFLLEFLSFPKYLF